MEKVQARAAVVVLLGMLVLMAGIQEADAQGLSIMSLDSNAIISCKALGNCDKKKDNRAPDEAHKYTRGCSPIHQCRG